MTIGGMIDSRLAAIIRFHGVSERLTRLARPMATVNFSSLSRYRSGPSRLFQFQRNVNTAQTVSTGVDSGKMIRQKICQEFSPSTRAASSRSLGIVLMYWRIRKMKNAVPPNEGTI